MGTLENLTAGLEGETMLNLTKWYCDCVGEDGDAFLGYWAQLRLGPFTIPYAATLYKPAHGAPREHASVRRCPPPVFDGTGLHWHCRRLHVEGWWSPYFQAHQHTLYQSSAGMITWGCLVPGAEASIDIDGQDRLSGLGYAELLTVSISPRRLPFDHLRWGRFLSPDTSLTWIEWSGDCPRHWVFRNGAESPKATIDEAGVTFPEASLEFDDISILRHGSLRSTALRTVPGASLLLGRRFRPAHETKWLARGTYSTESTTRTGWVIHEEVR